MYVLVACEESQRVCTAFSCDIQPPSGGHPEWHILGDVLNILNPVRQAADILDIEFQTMTGDEYAISQWDLIIAHPPCTYLSNAGACRLYPRKGQLDRERYNKGMLAKSFFMNIWYSACSKMCIENPIPSTVFSLPKYSQTIQPYEYGEPYSKKSCLWIRGLPLLTPTNIVSEYLPYVSCGTSANKGRPEKAGVSRKGGAAKVRSKTFWGIARAMAEQWG